MKAFIKYVLLLSGLMLASANAFADYVNSNEIGIEIFDKIQSSRQYTMIIYYDVGEEAHMGMDVWFEALGTTNIESNCSKMNDRKYQYHCSLTFYPINQASISKIVFRDYEVSYDRVNQNIGDGYALIGSMVY